MTAMALRILLKKQMNKVKDIAAVTKRINPKDESNCSF